LDSHKEIPEAGRTRAEKYLELAGVMFLALDRKGNITLINRRGCDILGYPRDEIIGSNWFSRFITPSQRDTVKDVFMKLMEGEVVPVEYFENTVLNRDGEERVIAWHNTLLKNEKGEITGTLSSGEDITEHKLAVRELEDMRELLDRTQALAGVGGWEYDIEQAEITWTEEVYRIYGVNPREFNPDDLQNAIKFYQGDDRQRLSRAFSLAVGEGRPYDLELRFRNARGRDMWVRTIGRAEKEEGEVKRLYGNIMDITERKKAVDALAESEAKYRALFEGLSEAVFVYPYPEEGYHEFVEVNEIACGMLEYTRGELLNLTVEDISETARNEESKNSRIRKKLIEDKRSVFEAVHITKSGRKIPVEVSAMVFSMEEKPMVMSLVRDISERKRAEEDRLKLQEQLQQSRKMESIGKLAGGIAHDFNNQLGAVVGLADLIRNETEEGSKLRRYAEDILTTAKRSTDLTSQLLAFARKGMYRAVPLDINHLVEEVISILKRSIDKRITIRSIMAENPPVVIGDPSQLQNAFLNLALNARDAMPSGGEMVFETQQEALSDDSCLRNLFDIPAGDYVRVSVSDSGVGMSKEIKDHIFEPFFTTKGPGKGTGMGLAAVYGTVINHGGTVNVYSEPERGTTFNMYFPLSPESERAPEIEKYIESETVRGSGHILLVDDEPFIINTTTAILENLGYSVITCPNGAEAVRLYGESYKSIDAVILDMVMPVMGGRETFIKLMEINPDVRVLLSTGFVMGGEAQEIMSMGAADFIHKPFRMVELSRKLAGILDQERS